MREKGFTLIEMLLVVAILGFLVAILLPSVGGVGSEAKDRATKASLRELKSAIEVYYIAFGAYPTENAWGNKDNVLLAAQNQSGYRRLIDQFPEDPYETTDFGNANTFDYVLSGGGDTYVITSDKSASVAATVGSDTADLNGAELYVTNARDITTD